MELQNFRTTYALILNYNSSKDTIELFNLLHSFNLDNLFVKVLDNNSKDEDILNLRQGIPHQNLVCNSTNLGYAGGNNIGINLAIKNEADFIWLLNPDIRVDKETLPVLLNLITSKPKIAAVGPRIISRTNKNEIFSDGGIIIYDERCHVDLKNYDQPLEDNPPSINFNIDYVDGSCLLINTNAIKELGYLPEEYFLYFEETDWCTKAKRTGWDLGINSYVNAYNLKSNRNHTYIYHYFKNRLIFARKYHPEYKKVYRYYWKLILKKIRDQLRYGKKDPFLKWEIKGMIEAYRFFI